MPEEAAGPAARRLAVGASCSPRPLATPRPGRRPPGQPPTAPAPSASLTPRPLPLPLPRCRHRARRGKTQTAEVGSRETLLRQSSPRNGILFFPSVSGNGRPRAAPLGERPGGILRLSKPKNCPKSHFHVLYGSDPGLGICHNGKPCGSHCHHAKLVSSWLCVTQSPVPTNPRQLPCSSHALTALLPLPPLRRAPAQRRTATATPAVCFRLQAGTVVLPHSPSPSLTCPPAVPLVVLQVLS